MKTKSILFTLLAVLLFVGCTTSSTTEKENRDMNDSNYNIIKASHYPIDTRGEKEFLVYHSDKLSDVQAFETEYERLSGEKALEFDGNMIIAKSGEKRSGGYNISVTDVRDAGRFTEVFILLESPGVECMATMALTNPYVVIKIPNDHKEVKFIEKNITVDCD